MEHELTSIGRLVVLLGDVAGHGIAVAGASDASSAFTVDPGRGLGLYSDGLVERRGESIDDGLGRLAKTLGGAGAVPASSIWTAMASGHTDDDVTTVTLRRH